MCSSAKISISGDGKVGVVRYDEFWGCWKAATCTAAVPSRGLHLGAGNFLWCLLISLATTPEIKNNIS